MSLCAQESYDDMAFEREMKALHRELLDAATTVHDSPIVVDFPSTGYYESRQFRSLGGFDTTIAPTLTPGITAIRGASAQGPFIGGLVNERGGICTSKEQPELFPFTLNTNFSMHVEQSSRSFWNGTNLQPQGHTHVSPKDVEPPLGSYKTWKSSRVVSKPTKGIMEAVIEGGYRSTVSAPATMPMMEVTALPRPPPSPVQLHQSRLATSTPILVPKVARKKTSTSKTKPTYTGRFLCPENCGLVCKSQGDLRRHLQSLTHQAPSFLCPNGCRSLFTRQDAAGRHAKNGCPQAMDLRK